MATPSTPRAMEAASAPPTKMGSTRFGAPTSRNSSKGVLDSASTWIPNNSTRIMETTLPAGRGRSGRHAVPSQEERVPHRVHSSHVAFSPVARRARTPPACPCPGRVGAVRDRASLRRYAALVVSGRRPLLVLLGAVLAAVTGCANGTLSAAAPEAGTSTTVQPVDIGTAQGPLRARPEVAASRHSGPEGPDGPAPGKGARGEGTEPGGGIEGAERTGRAPATTGRRGPGDALAHVCPTLPDRDTAPAPPALVAALYAQLANPAFAGTVVGASVWVEGYGEVLASHADEPLVIASNQKLLTALGTLAALPPSTRFTTEVVATGPVVDGVVHGDLVLVGGGDPTLTTHGPHSLASLVDQLLVAGVRGVTGSLVADESRYPGQRAAPGWPADYTPAYVGPMSALMVDDNRHRWDDAYLADPALGNGELFRAVLGGAGIAVAGPTRTGPAAAGATTVASLASPTVGELIGLMLLDSDNEVAELLTREVGVAAGGDGSTEAGTTALADALEDELCVGLADGWSDGSGLSWTDLRSARELRTLLQLAGTQPDWAAIEAGLPVAGRTGTLVNRFIGTPAQGNLRAKTGYLAHVRSLSGTLTTAGGRDVVFAILVNGPGADPSVDALDALVATLAADAS
ncbi:MAG: D-alanyl-D-alanine carboxypeptidase/D-alanyl-D-alanine-endopeptidase [Acidimicrobiia bacterium]|nr:D-alanyl-D-alanine carboxypeptidase/D-alanyl-D-alanine-endopeptidase [Acidimicrobiia bacterium]